MRALLLFVPLSGCAFGLDTELSTTLVAAPGAEEEGGLTRTSSDLAGRLFSMSAADMHVAQPPGLDSLWDQVLSTPLLVYVEAETDEELRLATALASEDGTQNPCEQVRHFPVANWLENPVFAAGPGVFDTSFAGNPATARNVELSGVVDEDGYAWRNGTLDAMLDTRELRPALGGLDDVCALVSDLGGECVACEDGEEACFSLVIDEVTAHWVDADFAVQPDRSECR